MINHPITGDVIISTTSTGSAALYGFDFALAWLKAGKRLARRGWNGEGLFIELQHPDSSSKMTSPYIFIDTTGSITENLNAPRSRVPWLASQTDLLADDWILVD